MAENENAGVMPVGAPMVELRPEDVKTTEGDARPLEFLNDDAVCTLVWENFQRAKAYVENNAWLLEWQETDILYQSPIPNRFMRVEQGRPPRVSRFQVAKWSRTLARAVKRALFAEQYPFFLRPTGKTTQEQIDAWSALIGKLLKRMKLDYWSGLMIDCQVLQGTGIGKAGWDTRTIIKKTRKRKTEPVTATMPKGSPQEIPTQESDAFTIEEKEVTESWPFFEYRRLGTTLFDPKWSTPDLPDESAGYLVDVDYVTFADLQRMRELECYQNIPDEATLKAFFFQRAEGAAPPGSQIEESMSSQGSMVAHAESRNRQTDVNPLEAPLLLLEQWDTRKTYTVLCYDGRKLCIRNEEHDHESSLHFTATWWPIDNCGYGMGIGRINGADQRINQGVVNECLKMLAYPLNAPILIGRGSNAPTQNVINRLGGFWQLDMPQGGDVRKEVGFMEMPAVPGDAWKMLDLSQRGGEEMSGASAPFQQGNLGGPGSSAARTATGAARIAGQSDQNVADPVDSFSRGVIIPVIEWLVRMVKLRMPLSEIREILSEKHAAIIETAIAEEQFLSAQFEVDVLAGQKLAARAGIQQLIPFFLQLVQQPQLLEYLHQKGKTIDFEAIEDLLLQVSDLMQQPNIFRDLTPQEMQTVKAMNPAMQKVQGAATIEKLKGQNKQAEIQTQGQVDLATKAAEIGMEHIAGSVPLERAEGLVERGADTSALKTGLQEPLEQ